MKYDIFAKLARCVLFREWPYAPVVCTMVYRMSQLYFIVHIFILLLCSH